MRNKNGQLKKTKMRQLAQSVLLKMAQGGISLFYEFLATRAGRKFPPCFFILIFVLSLSPTASFAVVRTWDHGANTANWSDCNNWSGNACPGAGDVATFSASSTSDATINAAFS